MVDTSARFPALGSIAVVAVTRPDALAGARAAVEETVRAFDLACSRFREDSELSAVNAAGGRAVRVSPLLLEAIAAAVRAARLTDGDVDPTVGAALVALGYDRDFEAVRGGAGPAPGGAVPAPGGAVPIPGGAVPAPGGAVPIPGGAGPTVSRPTVSLAAVPGWRAVTLDPVAGTIRVPRGVTLDLGATAKALAADRAAELAGASADAGVLVSLGGDIALAGPPPPDGWRVRVTDDHRAGLSAPGQDVTLRAGGLATSSTTTRRWETTTGRVHHVLDPGTGRPAAGVWRTVSVSAASCLEANIASTAAIVRGAGAIPWLESLGLPSRLVGADGAVRHVAGWPAEGDDLG